MVLRELHIAIELDFQRSAVSGLIDTIHFRKCIVSMLDSICGDLRYRQKVMHWCSMRAIQPPLYTYSNTYICYFFRQFHSYISFTACLLSPGSAFREACCMSCTPSIAIMIVMMLIRGRDSAHDLIVKLSQCLTATVADKPRC